MPSFSKRNKKGGKRFNFFKEGKKADEYLRRESSKKYVKNSGSDWKYGHLSSEQALTKGDKYLDKKTKKLVGRGAKFSNFDNDDNNETLDDFVKESRMKYSINKKNSDDDGDLSGSDMSHEDNVNDDNKIFMYRRDRKRLKRKRENEGLDDMDYENEISDNDGDLESSGDDIEYERDNDVFHSLQIDDANDIDASMLEKDGGSDDDNVDDNDDDNEDDNDDNEENEDGSDDSQDSEEDDDSDKIVRAKRKGKKKENEQIDFEAMAKQINENYGKDNSKAARLLNVSKQYLNGNERESESESESESSDSSMYGKNNGLSSSVDNNERVSIKWGNKSQDYYGADTQTSKLWNENESSKRREMRDEEEIGMEMQNAQIENATENDFLDMEMMQFVKDGMDDDEEEEGEHVEKEEKEKKVEENESERKNRIGKEDENEMKARKVEKIKMIENVENGNEISTIEKISKKKEYLVGNDKMAIVRRDHPELIGIVNDLKTIVKKLNEIENNREKAIAMKFDDGIEDCTLVLDASRTYGALLAFYLRLKASSDKNKSKLMEKTCVEMMKLKKSLNKMFQVYENSVMMMNSLPQNWDRKSYLLKKAGIKKKIIEKEHSNRIAKSNERKKMEKEKKQKKIAEKISKQQKQAAKEKLINLNIEKAKNWDKNVNEFDDLSRRQITTKIFKSQGLKRYRKQGIPRLKKKWLYEKKLKLWKRKGFKSYQGKTPNGRAENNISINMTHSKQFR